MTDWEVSNRVTLPWVRSGIIGATVLGLGRALGETMAVAMIGGAVLRIPINIYGPFTTVAATILTQLDGALDRRHRFRRGHAGRAGLVLAVISVAVNLAARLIIRRTSRSARRSEGADDDHDAVRRPRHRRRRVGDDHLRF